MDEQMNIQWFPGHMAKAKRMMAENLKNVDVLCEVIDARIPYSSRNPDIDAMAGSKKRLIVLNRTDQADPAVTAAWEKYFTGKGFAVIKTDSKSGRGANEFVPLLRRLMSEKIEKYSEKGQVNVTVRVMVAGIPNVGKSSFINRVTKRKAAKTSDRPGVTRGKQWVSLGGGVELLDTPGILWPRFDNKQTGENLAFTGAVKDDIIDIETLGAHLISRLALDYPERLLERYRFEAPPEADGFALLELAARKRGFLVSGGECDIERMAIVLLDEFRAGKLGRISLEKPE